jgi:hypothetical protein
MLFYLQNFYNLEIYLDVDDFEIPTSINGFCDWSPCSQLDVTITNCNTSPIFLIVNHLLMRYALNLNFLMLTKENWKMSTKVVVESVNVLNFKPITLLMNGKNLVVI